MALKDAIKEAYASASVDDTVVSTLELRHPTFMDSTGNPTAIRVANGFDDYNFRLENTAPLQPGQVVLFVGCPFRFTLPEWSESSAPTLQIAIDNVSREITRYLELAIATLNPIEVTYRPYLASDPSGPQMDPPYNFNMSKVTADVFQVTGTATINDIHNWPFPNRKYTPAAFPGLVR